MEESRKKKVPIVYVIQEIAGTKEGRPKINILGAAEYGDFKFLLPELSQMIFSPDPLIFKLRKSLKVIQNNMEAKEQCNCFQENGLI